MARIRSIFPGQWTDEDFVSCSAHARLLALGLRNEADDQGIFEWKPIGIKMRLLPADGVAVSDLLAELVENRQVMTFEAGGKRYGAIRNFMRWQNPKKPKSSYPCPEPVAEWVGKPTSSSAPNSTPPDDDVDEVPTKGGTEASPTDPSSEPVPNQSGNCSAEGGGRREEIKEPSVPKKPPERNGGSEAFGEFWSAYPSRGESPNPKKPALEKFLAAVKDGVPPSEIIDGAKRYASAVISMKTEPQFVKQATTWINQRCWEQYKDQSSAPKRRPQATDWAHELGGGIVVRQ